MDHIQILSGRCKASDAERYKGNVVAAAGVQHLRAELAGDDSCNALGITVKSSSPVLALCRMLIEAGHDPASGLEVYRGDVLALRVRSIGDGAKLQVNSHSTGFEPRLERRAAPPSAQTAPAPHTRAPAEVDRAWLDADRGRSLGLCDAQKD